MNFASTGKYDTERRKAVQIKAKAKEGKLYIADFRSWLKTNSHYKLVNKPRKLTDASIFECNMCGERRLRTPYSFRRNPPKCLTCSFDEKLKKKFKGAYTRISEYAPRIEVRHKCGSQFEVSASGLLQGRVTCSCLHKRVNYRTFEYHANEVKKVHNGEFSLVEFDKGKYRRSMAVYKHDKGCGQIFKQRVSAFLSEHYDCPKCFTMPNAITKSQAQQYLDKKYSSEYELVEFSSAKSKSKIKHQCGTIFSRKFENLKRSTNEVPCPNCNPSHKASRRIERKKRAFLLRGTETKTLDWLLDNLDVEPKDILHKRVPRFKYIFEGYEHTYVPDFWIPRLNMIIESKDMNTFGLGKTFYYQDNLYRRNRVKAKSVISSRCKFIMLVWKKGKLIELPKKWFLMSKITLTQHLDSNPLQGA